MSAIIFSRYEFYAVGFTALGSECTFLQTPAPTGSHLLRRGPEHIFGFSILVTMTPSKTERQKQNDVISGACVHSTLALLIASYPVCFSW